MRQLFRTAQNASLPVQSSVIGARYSTTSPFFICARAPTTRSPSRSNSKTLVSSFTSTPFARAFSRSEEHTSELQSRQYLVCRLLLEKKNKQPRKKRPT